MKKLASFIVLVVIFFSFQAEAATKAQLQAKVESYLNGITTMSADFVQSDSEQNLSGGKFYLKRPGKFIWEYDERQPILIVSDGSQLVYYDKKLKEVTYASLENTLASFLARKNIKLSGDVKLLDITDTDGIIKAVLTQKDKPEEGKLKLYFNSAEMLLSMLEVEDQYGAATRITFQNQVFGQEIDNKKFVFKNPKFHKNVWEKK